LHGLLPHSKNGVNTNKNLDAELPSLEQWIRNWNEMKLNWNWIEMEMKNKTKAEERKSCSPLQRD
jgi:hypothetical protein